MMPEFQQDLLHRLPDGRSMTWASYGASGGFTVVFCHGAPGSRRYVSRSMADAAVRIGCRLLVPDRPGFGGSGTHPGRTFLSWSKDLGNLTDSLGLKSFGMLGFSVGSPYALACAHQWADRVTGVALAGALGPGLAGYLDGMSPAMAQLVRAAANGSDGFRAAFGALLDSPEVFLDSMVEAMPDSDKAVVADSAIMVLLQSACRESLRQRGEGVVEDFILATKEWGFGLGGIRTPVHLWHGVEDRNAPALMAQDLAKRLPFGQAHMLPGEAHFCLFSHWEEILECACRKG